MLKSEDNISNRIFTPNLLKRMLLGAIIAFITILIFVVGAGKGDPAWGSYWRIKPLLLTPILGAVVGLCFDITQPLRSKRSWIGKLFFLLSILGVVIGIWMSLILGLSGTMWD